MNNLYRFEFQCGRMGSLEGLFIATAEEVKGIIGKQAYFGEVLGKHSEIYGEVEDSDISLVSDDHDRVKWLLDLMGGPNISGFNPFDYIEEEDEEED